MENLKEELRNNQNFNGGGLAVNITGKYESNRKALADLDETKRTAGEVGKSLRKKGFLFYAKTIKKVCEEWHHSGFYNGGKTMGRTYYTSKSDSEILEELKQLEELEKKEKDERLILSKTKCFFFTWIWEGNHPSYKVLVFKDSNKLDFSNDKNAIEITNKEYDDYRYLEGRIYRGWSEPTYDEILNLPTEEEKKKKERNERRKELRKMKKELPELIDKFLINKGRNFYTNNYYFNDELKSKLKLQLQQEEESVREEKLKFLDSINDIEDKLKCFFLKEVHPAPREIVEFKKSNNLSWSDLRRLYK